MDFTFEIEEQNPLKYKSLTTGDFYKASPINQKVCDSVLLVVLHAQVARTGNQHDSDIFQRPFDNVHVLVQVAGWGLGGVRQEGVLEVHTQGLRQIVVPKCQATLQKRKHTDD